MTGEDDVRLVYELLLGRAPSLADIEAHGQAEDWRQLLTAIAGSPEFVTRTGSWLQAPEPAPKSRPISSGGWADRHPPPVEAWTADYEAARWDLIADAMADERLLAGMRESAPLPDGYGGGFDERVVEYPWLISQQLRGRVLDAGSIANFAPVLDRVLPLCDELTIATLAPEPASFPERGVSYVYADLRDLPFRDDRFDVVFCLSTIEHVGCDTSVYGLSADTGAGPQREAVRAARELKRVLAPGGRMLLSVPFGRSSSFGWGRQFDGDELDELVGALSPERVDERIARFGADGWRFCDRAEVAHVEYYDALSGPLSGEDGATAARAVACVALQF